jgi:hypothetical protein
MKPLSFQEGRAGLVSIALLILLAGAGAGYFWLKAAHIPSDAVSVAQTFIKHLQAKQFEQAHQLTMKNGYVGKTAEALKDISAHELCRVDNVVGHFPFQSNGNRLRRWISGAEIEMPEVQVEFEGNCLLGVTVRRNANKQWRIFKFAGHAG